jgi:hypothetical protein
MKNTRAECLNGNAVRIVLLLPRSESLKEIEEEEEAKNGRACQHGRSFRSIHTDCSAILGIPGDFPEMLGQCIIRDR